MLAKVVVLFLIGMGVLASLGALVRRSSDRALSAPIAARPVPCGCPEGSGMSGALVTGAARRLGREMALCLARRGHDVVIHYSASAEAAEATADEARAFGVRATALQADLLDEDQTGALIGRAAEALGKPLTVLVNNASTFDYDNIRSASRQELGPQSRYEPAGALCPDPGLCGAMPTRRTRDGWARGHLVWL